MNKVATYLNEHLMGEVLTQSSVLTAVEQDKGILTRRPEMVARPANTSDIRKIMRFCFQLAEKKHILPITARGEGTDSTGGAIGAGVIVDTKHYLHNIIGIDSKQRLIHVQSGMPYLAVNSVLATHKGLGLPSVSFTNDEQGTIGGAISVGAAGINVGAHGTIGSKVKQLEVVLSNGDVLQTGRISKHELSKKKGLATFEGEIYRQIDNLITDNEEQLQQFNREAPETVGYSGLAKVREKDGSFDLTPLFIGAQGSLGIISEIIMKADFVRQDMTVVVMSFANIADAQAALDLAMNGKASAVELMDGRLIRRAAEQGKKFDWAPKEVYNGAIVLAVFDDFSSRTRAKLAKKLVKKVDAIDNNSIMTKEIESINFIELHDPIIMSSSPDGAHNIMPQLFSGLWLPSVQWDSFLISLKSLEEKYNVELPFFGDMKSGFIDILPIFDVQKVSNRQKLLKLAAELAVIIQKCKGSFAGRNGDGRLKSGFVRETMTKEERALHDQAKQIFDPFGLLSAGIKMDVPIKELVLELNSWCRLQK